jgi:hypothetical protein
MIPYHGTRGNSTWLTLKHGRFFYSEVHHPNMGRRPAKFRLCASPGCGWMTSGSGDQSMQPKFAAVLALTMISYLAVPPAVIKQATALLSWG